MVAVVLEAIAVILVLHNIPNHEASLNMKRIGFSTSVVSGMQSL